MIIFVLGGIKSGKSKFAENLAHQFEEKYKDVFYIATYKNLNNDEEMIERIKEHRKRRDKKWKTLEISKVKNIVKEIKKISNAIVIIECITTLVSYELINLNNTKDNTAKNQKGKILSDFENMIKEMKKNREILFILVSNEVGMGIIPDNKLARIYEDVLGSVNQKLAENSDSVYFMIAGIPIKLKG